MILAAVVLLGLFSARVRASTTWTVTTVADSIDGFCTISLCSLRDANAVAFGGDTITFDPSLNGQTITLTNGALTIGADGLTIQGPGANLLTISGAGGGVVVSKDGLLVISGLTITGGGIGNYGRLTVNNCTFSGNTANYGGAIYNYYFGTSGLHAIGIVTVMNCTFSGNSATYNGGAIENLGAMKVVNSTFSGNSASSAGAILSFGNPQVENSILTGDAGGECVGNGCPINGDHGNVVDATPVQPFLAPLGWYGGTTQTMLPLPGSEAVCAGLTPDIFFETTTDQRGFARTSPAGCVDAGAVQTNYLIVTNNSGGPDPSPVCGPTADSSTSCSLADALNEANTARQRRGHRLRLELSQHNHHELDPRDAAVDHRLPGPLRSRRQSAHHLWRARRSPPAFLRLIAGRM